MKRLRFQYNDGGRAKAGFQGKAGDCCCRAIAIATGVKYQVVYQLINNFGAMEKLTKKAQARRRGRGVSHARTGVYKTTMYTMMEKFGFRWVPLMGIGTGCRHHLRHGEIPMTGTIIANVSRHYVAIIDGVMHDTHDPSRGGTRCCYGYWVKD